MIARRRPRSRTPKTTDDEVKDRGLSPPIRERPPARHIADPAPAVKALYDGWHSRYLSLKGIDPSTGPVLDEATFAQLAASTSHVFLFDELPSGVAGFVLPSVETEPDDFLLPSYGDFALLVVGSNFYGLGIESRLYVEAVNQLRQRNISALRTTVASGDLVQQALWRSLGAMPVAERLHRSLL